MLRILLLFLMVALAVMGVYYHTEIEAGISQIFGQKVVAPTAHLKGYESWGLGKGAGLVVLFSMALAGVVVSIPGIYFTVYDYRLQRRAHPRDEAGNALLAWFLAVVLWIGWIAVLLVRPVQLGLALSICLCYCVAFLAVRLIAFLAFPRAQG